MSRMSGLAAIPRRLVFESGVDSGFDYLVPDELWPVQIGQRIAAPFGKANKQTEGYCVGIDIAGKTAGKKDKVKTYHENCR